MLFVAMLLFRLALPDGSAVRLVNTSDGAVEATATCRGSESVVVVNARDVADLAECGGEIAIASNEPLLAYETNGSSQKPLTSGPAADANCEPLAMAVPLYACERGSATASVNPVEGATYLWTAEGAGITTGQGTPRVTLAMVDNTLARVTAVVTAPGCSRSASGVIAIRKPLVLVSLNVPESVDLNQSVTVAWSYAAGSEPGSQVLKGNAVGVPVALAKDQRSYTFMPRLSGTNSIELVASYAPAISVAQNNGGKRRSVAPSLVTATNCTDVHATKQFKVRGCGNLAPQIEVADEVEAGTTVSAHVALSFGEAAKWTIDGGTVLGTDEGATIQLLVADLTQELHLHARISRGDECVVETSRDVRVRPRASCSQTAPAAAVNFVTRGCTTVTVKATFTGTPPFRGTWSNGTTFETNESTITKELPYSENYTIAGFSDATCYGSVTSDVAEHVVRTSVVVAASDPCQGATLTATFTGTPPFRGRWWQANEWFETSAFTASHTPPNESWGYGVDNFTDAFCQIPLGLSSNRIELRNRPGAAIDTKVVCTDEFPGTARVAFYGDAAYPVSVQWSDGVVSAATGSGYPISVLRSFITHNWSETYSIVRANDKSCEANVRDEDRTLTVSYRPRPRINRDTTVSDLTACVDTASRIVLDGFVLHPDTILTWTATDAQIVSGQGTAAIEFKAAMDNAKPRITVTASYPDGACPSSDSVGVYVVPPPEIVDFKVVPSTIPPGGSAVVSFKYGRGVASFGMKTNNKYRDDDLTPDRAACGDGYCAYNYHDTIGGGDVLLILDYGGACSQQNAKFITLKIQ